MLDIILINNKVIVTRHVDVIEEDIKCIGFEDNCDKKKIKQ